VDVKAQGTTEAAIIELFYRGDFDRNKAEAPNGAVVNEDYLRFVEGGS